jgi:membrane fusion protein, multidrug efflux system
VRRLVLALALAACGGDPAPPGPRDGAPPAQPPRPPAGPADDAAQRGFVGVIAAAQSADVVPRFAGVLAAVHVRPGDRVTAGQVVAELDPRPVEEDVRAAEATARQAAAEVRKAQVDVADARRKLALERRAAASGVSAATAVEEARLGLDRARAAVQSAEQEARAARSRANTAKSHLAETRLTAPFDGIVALRFRDAGAPVDASVPILKVVKLGELRLRFAVPPQRARALKPGMPVTAAVDTVESPIAAVIRQVSPALDPASELILVEAELTAGSDAAAELRPGLGARVAVDRPPER